MKNLLYVFGVTLILFCMVSRKSQAEDTANRLFENFRNPPREYSVTPFWSWNGTLEPEKIRWQIEQMVEKGVYGAFMHARAGNELSKTPYFSEGWWKAIEAALITAKEKGFSACLYDEDKWPSGSAGGRVRAADSMANSKKALRYRIVPVTGPSPIKLPDEKNVTAIIAVQPNTDGSLRAETLIDLTDFPGKTWEVPPGVWQIWFFTQHIEQDGVNYLRKQTVRTFMDITHEEYFKRFGNYFGTVIPGMFFDEISAGPHQSDLVWTDDFLPQFQQRKGYNLRKFLPIIFRDAGTGTPKIRCDYYDVYTQLYTESWFKQIGEWCAARGIFLTGHTYEDVNSYMSQGNYFQTWDPVQIPGTDNEDFRYTFPRKIGWFKPKQMSGLAHSTGKKRIMGEILGGPGWGVTLEDMRYGVGMLGVYGLNFFIPHLFHYSMETPQAMDDWPNSWFYQNPYWKYFRYFADYIRRVSFMGSQGRHVCDIAILFPVTSQWASGITTPRGQLDPGGGAFGGKLQDEYLAVQEALITNQWDFDAIDPSIFAKSDIAGTIIRSGDGEYRVLILPPSTTVQYSVLKKLLQFYQAGGSIISVGQLPTDSWEGGKNDPEVLRIMWEIFRVNPQTMKSGYDETMPDVATEYVMNSLSDFKTEQNKNDGIIGAAYFTKKIHTVPEILSQLLEPDIAISQKDAGYFAYLHRRIGEVDFYNVMNTGKKPLSCAVTFKASGRPEIWDPVCGDRKDITNYIKAGKNRTKVKLDMDQWENVLIVFQPQKESYQSPAGFISQSTLKNPGILQVASDNVKISGLIDSDEKNWKITGSIGEKVFHGTGTFTDNAPVINLNGQWKFLMVPEELDYRWGITIAQSEVELPVMDFKIEQSQGANEQKEWAHDIHNTMDWKQVKIFDSLHPAEGCSRYASLWSAHWITYYDYRIYPGDLGTGTNDTLYFRKEINLDKATARGWFNIAAEEFYTVLLNGKVMASGRGYESAGIVDLTPNLQSGLNELFIIVTSQHYEIPPTGYSEKPQGALLVQGEILNEPEKRIAIFSDETWEVSRDKVNWRKSFALASPPLGVYGDPWKGNKRLSYPATLWYRQLLPPGAINILPPVILGDFEIYINGNPLPKKVNFPCSVTPYLQSGKNYITLKVQAKSGKEGLLKPLRLVVEPSEVVLQDWKNMGLWWYSGRGMYTTNFTMPSDFQKSNYTYVLDPGRVNHFAEVWINGTLVETRPWQPFTVDVTRFLQKDENTLTIVVSNLLANEMQWNIFDNAVTWARSLWWHDGTLLRESEKLISGLLGPVRLVPNRQVEIFVPFEK